MKRVIVDTGPLVAYFDRDSEFHAWARDRFRELADPLISCQPVLTEALFVLKRGGMDPDLVLVALGVPRQELWIHALAGRRHGIWMGVGGSFDVWAGIKKRAPGWMSALQIEWLYRLIQEPTRWRRMLALPEFFWAVLRERR